MSERTVRHVAPNPKGGWDVKKEKASRASKHFDRKQDAVDYGRQSSKQEPLGQLKIHKKDGTIQEERTYGKDPHPPKG